MSPHTRQRIQKSLAKNHACYVLITCDAPSADGKMHVEMTYEGDAAVASYLLQGAQTFIDEQEEFDPLPASRANKIHQL